MAGRTFKARALSCPNCGARLRWGGDAPIIECRYCQTHVVVETGRVTQEATTVVSQAAPPTLWIVGGLVALAIAGGVTSWALGGRSAQAPGKAQAQAVTSSMTELAATPLAATAADVAARHRVTPYERRVSITLSDGPFGGADFYWDEAHPDHVQSISLRPREGADLADVVAKARAQLGRTLRPAGAGYYQWGAKGASFNLSSTLMIGVHNLDDPRWRERLAALWRVMKGAALGTADAIDVEIRRDLFNLDYPLGVIAEIGFDTVVDDAAREVHRVAPAADSDGARHTIGIGHPWLESAALSWENKAGGKWYSVTLYFPAELDFKTQHAPIEQCLTAQLGAPAKLVQDHLAGTFSLQYRGKGGKPWVDVSSQTLSMYPHYTFGDPATAAEFRALIAALAACR